ncbi:hypothetical protein NBRC111894_4655 [Sporolactobacillus inulinus]|uniref:Uncharacterized protein n=1 Tax=Sporolactobacillus inulinus TaxID=2078 RepID=A0A4Y1ZJE3_9BACL|nr:hypothetical protein [Sporolactobacillus inulinus]GAY79101.1 hypothetical protein NBRC111894_4655 [Sporolactobacillus inulinus]
MTIDQIMAEGGLFLGKKRLLACPPSIVEWAASMGKKISKKAIIKV